MSTSIAAVSPAPSIPASSGSLASDLGLDNFSFHDLVSIVNPLQHIPIVATLYRAVTGDTIKPLERVAGDSLYGGLWGFVSSVANVAYQEITGKDFGDTALAFLEGKSDAPTALAANASPATTFASANNNAPSPVVAENASFVASGPPRPLQAAFVAPSSEDDAAELALMSSMNAKGFDSELSQRALAAYGKSLASAPPDSIPAF
jgi:hypothetical protein